MSQRLPYEEHLQQHWNDASLPDVDMAWADMNRRLEDDDDDRVAAWWRRGCLGWSALILLLLGGGLWFWLNQDKTSNKTKENQPVQTIRNGPAKTVQEDSINRDTGYHSQTQEPNTISKNTSSPNISSQIDEGEKSSEALIPGKNSKRKNNSTILSNKRINSIPISNKSQASRNKPGSVSNTTTKPVTIKKEDSDILKNPQQGVTSITASQKVDTAILKPQVTISKPDSSVSKPTSDTAVQSEIKTPASQKTDSIKKSKLQYEFGAAVQQQIPFDGQKATPYNSLGRKGTLRDYIPSAYFRVKKNSWFAQIEFKYGAPQYTREIIYDTKSTLDTGTNTIITNSSTLKKTYYHQLSLGFHYYPVKNWSIGTGLVWNRFSSAISNDLITKRKVGSQVDSTISSVIQKKKLDSVSVFSKSYLQFVFETQYDWKRFGIGARYALGLEPFIKFQTPAGIRREKNSSLQVFLRYRLWQSRRK